LVRGTEPAEQLGEVRSAGRSGSTGNLSIECVRSQINSSGPNHRARNGIDRHSREETKVLPSPEYTFSHQMNQGHLTLHSVRKPDPESIAGSGFHAFNGTQQSLLQRRNFGLRFKSLGLAPRLPQLQTRLECPLRHKTDRRGDDGALRGASPGIPDPMRNGVSRGRVPGNP
jgi:hypothetical protein